MDEIIEEELALIACIEDADEPEQVEMFTILHEQIRQTMKNSTKIIITAIVAVVVGFVGAVAIIDIVFL